jgi:thiol-disulfide isomerase/thioredoxin
MPVSRLFSCLLLGALAGCASGGGGQTAPANVGDSSPATVDASGSSSFVVADMNGAEHDLGASLQEGQTVALIFWQTWCGSCRKEAPELARAAAEYGGRIRFLGVVPGKDETVDDDKVRAAAKDWGYTFPQVRDRDLALSKRFGVTGTPTIVVLGSDQKVLFNEHRAPKSWAAYERPNTEGPSAQCTGGVCPVRAE